MLHPRQLLLSIITLALIYAALERNTGKVGLKSNLCTTIKAVNPEIAAISQHQVSIYISELLD